MNGYQARFTNFALTPYLYPEDARTIPVSFLANQINLPGGLVLGICTSANASEVQTLTPGGTVSGGTLNVNLSGAWVTINATDTAATVQAKFQAALTATYGFGSGTVTVAGGPLTTGVLTVTFAGICANQPQPLMQLVSALTGAGAACTAARTTAGSAVNKFEAYNANNTDGSQTAKLVLPINISTDPAGNITAGPTNTGGPIGQRFGAQSCYYRGLFDTASLSGLDTAGAGQLGRLISGTVASGLLELA